MKTYRGYPQPDGTVLVCSEEGGDRRLLGQVLPSDPSSRLTSLAALGRGIFQEMFGPWAVEQDPDRFLQFMFDVVARLDQNQWTLSEAEISAWNVAYEVQLARPSPGMPGQPSSAV